MIHYGDISKISGYDVPIVDCVVGGSPCQDLSVAGKRAGLDGERSGLFMEQIRITKEMRDKDERINGRSGVNVRPRFFIWENVPGAFSSNKGEDFRIVLEKIAKIVDKDAVIPMPEINKNKWTTSGAIVGDGWSIAWRILDAQFWGVPQRRRRITLIADFGGQCAKEILFERRSLSGDSEESREKRQGTTEDAQGCFGIHDRDGERKCMSLHLLQDVITSDKISPCLSQGNSKIGQASVGVCIALEPGIASREGGHIYENVSGTLRSNMGDNQISVAYPIRCYDIGDRRRIPNEYIDASPTLLSQMGTGGNNVPVVVKDSNPVAYCIGNGQVNDAICPDKELCKTLNCMDDPMKIMLVEEDVKNEKKTHYIVRRLTPLECERLQGYPDGWTDVGEYIDSKGKKKKPSDSARYKALGNSIALPPWKWVIKRLCSHYERDATLCSLFDGIGGFPYVWEQINGKGSCLWASEIEDFPIAVTKERIG